MPRVSLDYFFLGENRVRKVSSRPAAKMTTKQLRQKLRTAMMPAGGSSARNGALAELATLKTNVFPMLLN